MFMKLFLTKFCLIIFIIFFLNNSYANNFNASYNVSTKGIKIGNFNWSLNIENNTYETKIDLKNSGLLSALYKFEGSYIASGVIENGMFKTESYKQIWKTRKKTKIVNMLIDNYLIELTQEPLEEEIARINLEDLYFYFDPITSFINILNGESEVKTVDGRRVYKLKKNYISKSGKIVLNIENYKNIWADHKRNDLKTIEFFVEEGLLPSKILIHFKERVFKLEKN